MPCIQQALSKCSVGGWTGWSTLAILVCGVTLRAYQVTPGRQPLWGKTRPWYALGLGELSRGKEKVAVLAVENTVMR